MKVGFIRCQQTEDFCPGLTDFKVASTNKGVFESINEPIEIIGFNSCGGCPGKKIATRVDKLIKLGAEAIVLASCITKGTPIGFPCPHHQEITNLVEKRIENSGKEVKLLTWSH